MTWSWTTVNRSSRASRSIVRWSGAVAAGFEPCTKSTEAGARPAPRRRGWRRPGSCSPTRSGPVAHRARHALDSGAAPDRLAMIPAPRWPKWPASTHSPRIDRHDEPPLRLRSGPHPMRNIEGRRVARSVASDEMSAARARRRPRPARASTRPRRRGTAPSRRRGRHRTPRRLRLVRAAARSAHASTTSVPGRIASAGPLRDARPARVHDDERRRCGSPP